MAGAPLAALRVKRRLSALGPEPPPEALLLLLACKRARRGDGAGDVERSVFTFAGTVRSRDDSPESVRQALLCARSQYQHHRSKNTHHQQQQKQTHQQEQNEPESLQTEQQHQQEETGSKIKQHHQLKQHQQQENDLQIQQQNHQQPHHHQRRRTAHVPLTLEKCREERRAGWKERRYRVITAQRAPPMAPGGEIDGKVEEVNEGGGGSAGDGGVEDDAKEEMKRLFQVFDVVLEEDEEEVEKARRKKRGEKGRHAPPSSSAILCNSVELIREKLLLTDAELHSPPSRAGASYVYDLYYSEETPPLPLVVGAHKEAGGQGGEGITSLGEIDRVLSVQPYFFADEEEERLVVEEEEVEEAFEDEDDENAESNWRNDYPDEGDFDEEREFFGDSDLSSDSGEEGYSLGGRYRPPVGGDFQYDYSLDLPTNDSD